MMRCPFCQSPRIVPRQRARQVGATVGTVAGVVSGALSLTPVVTVTHPLSRLTQAVVAA